MKVDEVINFQLAVIYAVARDEEDDEIRHRYASIMEQLLEINRLKWKRCVNRRKT